MTVWLEVALNGGAGRARQPLIPLTPQEIIEDGLRCADAGAAILHLHAYDPATGRPCEDADIYSEIIEGLRARCDAIVYPTLALTGSEGQRFAPVESLAERGLLEWCVVDPGSVNITHAAQFPRDQNGILYANPDAHIRRGLHIAAAFGSHPSFAIYEPGFVRQGAAWASRYAGLPQPIYRLMLSEDFQFGLPPRPYALAAYQALLEEFAPAAPWMVSGLGGDVGAIAETVLDLGGHIRVGLEDASLGCEKSNRQLTEEAVSMIRQFGHTLATADEIRRSLASPAEA